MKSKVKWIRYVGLFITAVAAVFVTACADSEDKRTAGMSKKVTWDFSDDSFIVDQVGDDSALESLTLYDNKEKKNYTFACENCRLENGELIIGEGGSMTLLTELGGVGAVMAESDESNGNFFNISEGYSLDKLSEVNDASQLIWGTTSVCEITDEAYEITLDGMSNYIKISSETGEVGFESLSFYYDGESTELLRAELNPDFYGYLLEGECYDSTKEVFSFEDGIFQFYLNIYPDSPYIDEGLAQTSGVIYGIPDDRFTTGDLITKDGTKKSQSEPLAVGDSIEVKAGAYTFAVPLPVSSQFKAANLKETIPTGFCDSVGEINVLVVPLYFEDLSEYATEEYKQELYSYLGRVMAEDGNVTDYTSDEVDYSFTEYFDLASYGNLKLNCFVTDYYQLEGTYEENGTNMVEENEENIDAIQTWVNSNYAAMINKLDQDDDGLFDAVIFLNVPYSDFDGFNYYTLSYQGAYNTILNYGTDRAITSSEGSAINTFSSVNAGFFRDLNGTGKKADVLCHEFSHQLGLIDYYDVTYSGINAVGGYDMQSSNEGDWNVYSKFGAGWITPTVVTQKQIDEGVELTIGAFEQDGGAIVIPTEKTVVNADGNISPFEEYIIVDLFTPEGLYASTCEYYGLTEPGVRIYHVDARLISIDLEDEAGNAYQIGTQLQSNVYNVAGKYQLELLQKSGHNTFTNLGEDLYPYVCNDDLFHAGDSFSMETHSEFFADQKMNDGSALDYTITVISMDDNSATIRIGR